MQLKLTPYGVNCRPSSRRMRRCLHNWVDQQMRSYGVRLHMLGYHNKVVPPCARSAQLALNRGVWPQVRGMDEGPTARNGE